jgi:Bacterial conjugation TrbI-like protein
MIEIDPRKFLTFFKSKTGRVTAFGIVFFIGATLLTGMLYYRHGAGPTSPATAPNLDKIADKSQQPSSWLSGKPDAGFANKHLATQSDDGSPASPAPTAPAPLPISLYHGNDQEIEVSDNYAPYGRMIQCETVNTIDSAKIETPIVGFVTKDLWHDGRLIIPAGAEVHGKAQVDPSRERIASDNDWMIIWRTTDRMNGAELPLHGVALDMERNETTGTWQLTDGSAGLKGDILRTDNWEEIKLFVATFLSAATTGLEDTQTASNALTGQTTETPLDTPKNAALAGTSAVLNQYAQQILDSIKRDGVYVRVPAGKQFYLYVTQTIDLDNAKRGQSLVDLKPENQKP